MEQTIQRWQDEQRQERRRDDAADDHRRQRTLDFRTGSGVERHR